MILAGGKGTRLRPYTTNFPKPLMPVGDKPILEIVIKQLENNGITNIIITVGHLEGLIRAFFRDGEKLGVNIEYSIEERPLGTAGPLNLIKDKLQERFLVMNGDILSDINYTDMLKSHQKSGSIATIALTQREVNIDFGVIELNEKHNIIDYIEKPTINHFVSMGIYIFEHDILDNIKPDIRSDLPDLINRLIKNEEPINAYIHKGYWLDIGRPEDYEKACNDIDEL